MHSNDIDEKSNDDADDNEEEDHDDDDEEEDEDDDDDDDDDGDECSYYFDDSVGTKNIDYSHHHHQHHPILFLTYVVSMSSWRSHPFPVPCVRNLPSHLDHKSKVVYAYSMYYKTSYSWEVHRQQAPS